MLHDSRFPKGMLENVKTKNMFNSLYTETLAWLSLPKRGRCLGYFTTLPRKNQGLNLLLLCPIELIPDM